jgi:ABC-type glutathione transport system ATPase component
VVGIHGMGGVGKTTISKALCNQMVGDFVGKACHIEFGGSSLLNLRKKVLQDLTEADARILVNEIEEEKVRFSDIWDVIVFLIDC